MLVHGPRALDVNGFSGLETLDFDSVDRCFAKMAAAGFVGLIAVAACSSQATGSIHQRHECLHCPRAVCCAGESTDALAGLVATHLAPIEDVQQHANNHGDSNHDARDAVRMFGDRHPVYAPQQEAADESDQDDVDDEIYECVHGDLGSLRIVFGRFCGSFGCCGKIRAIKR